MEISLHHRPEKQDRHRYTDREFGERVTCLGLQIPCHSGQVAERDEPEYKKNRFDKRRHCEVRLQTQLYRTANSIFELSVSKIM